MADTVLSLTDIRKSYPQANGRLPVLKGCSLYIAPKQTMALVGPSGCGKSTLLQVAGLLDTFEEGELTLMGEDISTISEKARTELRREYLGFVYQFHHLLDEFTALENVCMPLRVAGNLDESRAKDLLDRVGLSARMTHRPSELSGGEKQRVALARALVHKPKLMIADEPTGNLDPHLANTMFTLINELVRQEELSALIATHNHDLAAQLDSTVTLKDGRIDA